MYVAVCQWREKVYAANDWIGLCNPSALLRFAYVNLRGEISIIILITLLRGMGNTNAFFKGTRFCRRKRIGRFASTLLFRWFSTVHTKTFENDRITRCDVSWTLCACYKHTRLWYFRSSFLFWCVSELFWPSTLVRYGWVFDENAQRISVDGRPKRIEMYAISNENTLVWTGPKTGWDHRCVSRHRRVITMNIWVWDAILNNLVAC